MTISNLLPILAICLYAATSASGQDDSSDTLVTEFDWKGSTEEIGACVHTSDSIRYEFKIKRVVGGEFALEANGSLKDPADAVQQGIVSEKAELMVGVYDAGYYGSNLYQWRTFNDRILINGEPVAGTLHNREGSESTYKFMVDIGDLRFARRVPGEAVSAFGVNELVIESGTRYDPISDSGDPACGLEMRETLINPLSLEFDAMAPVILVHGNNSTPEFFERFNFKVPFGVQNIPFEYKSVVLATGAIKDNGDTLVERTPDIAEEFGAKHVHIVAHSKGGLDSRDALVKLYRKRPHEVGVLSLTTLCTPHMGSAGADYSWHGRKRWFAHPNLRAILGVFGYNDGIPFLTVDRVRTFNRANLSELPPEFQIERESRKVQYYAVSADANLDDSTSLLGAPTIQEDEGEGTGHPAFLLQVVYRTLGNVKEVKMGWFPPPSLIEIPTSSFELNDFLVTEDSAKLESLPASLQSHRHFVPWASRKANHPMIGSSSEADAVIDLIRLVQPMKEFR